MLLIDENDEQIHASVPRDIIPQFDEVLKEGNIIHLEKFNVSKSNGTYHPIDGEYKIYFKNDTIVKRLEDQHLPIPRHIFSFIEFKDIPTRCQSTKILTDIVGKLKAITEIEIVSKRNGDTSQKRDLILENIYGSTIKFTIWDEMLDEIPIDLSHLPSTPVILIVTSTIVDMFKGVCYLKPTCATKMYYNLEIQEVAILLKSETLLKDASVQLTENATKGTKNLSDLMFENRKELIDIFTIMEEPQTQEKHYTCKATITKVFTNYGCVVCFTAGILVLILLPVLAKNTYVSENALMPGNKTSLKLAVARTKLLKNKKGSSLVVMKRELAQLLEAGQERTARIRLDWRLSHEVVMEDCSEEERLLDFRESVRCKVFLGFTSNLISSGVRETVRYLVEHRMAREVPSSPTAFATSNYNMDMRHIQLHYGYASHFSLCMGPSKVDYDDQTPKDLIWLRNQSTVADAVLFIVVEQLAPFLLDKLKKEVKLVLSAPKDVQELHDIFDNIRDVLDDAEKRHVKNVLLNLEKNEIKKVPESVWLEKLKDASYEMEDVLDEWRTKILKSEIAADESSAPDGVDGARTGKKKGLITEDRANIDPEALPFARKAKEVGRQGLSEGASLVEV
ncbi:hypothetical protein GIB67_016663, partial [Kingdonia uniflora]